MCMYIIWSCKNLKIADIYRLWYFNIENITHFTCTSWNCVGGYRKVVVRLSGDTATSVKTVLLCRNICGETVVRRIETMVKCAGPQQQ